MNTGKAGEDLIKLNEGLALKAYYCPAGKLTIGYGHTGPDVKVGQKITKADADKLLDVDLRKFEAGVLKLCGDVKPNQNQFDAFVCFAYNVGLANFGKSSILKNFKAGKELAAANAFGMWVKATVDGKKKTLPGLVKRRAQEKALFLTPVEAAAKPAATPRPIEVPAVSGDAPTKPETAVDAESTEKPMVKSKELWAGTTVSLGALGNVVNTFTSDDLVSAKDGLTDLQTTVEQKPNIPFHNYMVEGISILVFLIGLFIVYKRLSARFAGHR